MLVLEWVVFFGDRSSILCRSVYAEGELPQISWNVHSTPSGLAVLAAYKRKLVLYMPSEKRTQVWSPMNTSYIGATIVAKSERI